MKNAFDLTGRRVLVTGARDGIGAATSRVCAKLGAELLLIDVQDSSDVAAQIRENGGKATSIISDVSTRTAIDGLAREAGGLVLNAAICPWDDDWDEANWDANFDRVLAVNVFGSIHAARAFLPGMIRRRWGRVVFVGSLAGRTGGLIAGHITWRQRAEFMPFVKWLARAGPHNVMVNGVAPASVHTPMMRDRPVDLTRIPVGRKADPDEVAWPIAFLCSAAASYKCGAVLDVNGGVYMGRPHEATGGEELRRWISRSSIVMCISAIRRA
jgi:NAD(P)-dependent dehydrogenase (short-subunit alcohol dehydrogenase family)